MENQISKNITLQQVIASSVAKSYGIDNTPSQYQYEACKLLAENVIEPLFEKFGRIGWTSYFRCKKLNSHPKIRGSATSDHQALNGSAVDLDTDVFPGISKLTNAEIFKYIKENLRFDQLIWEFGSAKEPGWVHVSYRKKDNRNMILISFKNKLNETKYLSYK